MSRPLPTVRRAALPTLAVALAATLAPQSAAACSLATIVDLPFAQLDVTSFIGRATGDTLDAGPGAVRFRIDDGHSGRPVAGRPIRGQVVQVERLAPWMPDSVVVAIQRAGGRVLLVPWDYAADCTRVPWAGSARWLPDAKRGLFDLGLRDRAHWAGGMPTFDVSVAPFVPYTGETSDALWFVAAPRRDTLPLLTPDELLDLRATLPTGAAVSARLDDAFAPLRAWVAEHPDLAVREPARTLLGRASGVVPEIFFHRRPVPLAGTYRVTVWLADSGATGGAGDSATFFVRTEDRPTSALGSVTAPGGPLGMYVLACAAATESALPPVRPPVGCQGLSRATPTDADAAPDVTDGYLAFGDSVWSDGAGGATRRGSVDVAHGSAAFRARLRSVTWGRVRDGSPGDTRRYMPGSFAEGADGAVTFSWTFGSDEAPRLRITAVRTSTVVLERPPRSPGHALSRD